MLIAASSSSTCFTTTPWAGAWSAIQCMIDEAGVIGYCARNLHPAARAPSAIAWLPVISRRAFPVYRIPRFRLPPSSSTCLYPALAAFTFASTISRFLRPHTVANADSTVARSISKSRTAAPRATVFFINALFENSRATRERGNPILLTSSAIRSPSSLIESESKMIAPPSRTWGAWMSAVGWFSAMRTWGRSPWESSGSSEARTWTQLCPPRMTDW